MNGLSTKVLWTGCFCVSEVEFPNSGNSRQEVYYCMPKSLLVDDKIPSMVVFVERLLYSLLTILLHFVVFKLIRRREML